MSRRRAAGPLGWTLRHPRPVLAFWVALAALAAPGLLLLAHDNAPEVYFVRDHQAVREYQRFTDTFGDLGALRLWASGDALWTPAGLSWLGEIEEAAPRIAGVVATSGPWSYQRARHPAAAWPPPDGEAFREQLADDRLARNADLLASDGETAVVLIALRRLSAEERRHVLGTLESRLAERPGGIEAGLAGLATLNRALDRELTRVLTRHLPVAMLLAIVLVALALRSPRDTILVTLFSAFCQVLLLGAMGYRGASFNVVTSVLPLLIFVLSLATAIHLLIEVRECAREGRTDPEAVRAAYRLKLWPVVWTAITTGAAFGSLAWSDSPPVRSLGIWSAAGIALVLVAALTLLPALLGEGRRGEATAARTRFETWTRALGERAVSFALARRRSIHAVFGLLLLLALAGIPRLEVETSVLEYFGRSHPERQRIEALESRGAGTVFAELVLELESGSFDDTTQLDRLAGLTERLRAEELVSSALGPSDLPASDHWYFRRARSMLLSEDGRVARISVGLPFAGFGRLEPLFERATAAAAEALPDAEAFVTGPFPMVLAAQRSLLTTMVLSLGVTLLVVLAVLLALVRDRRLALAAVLPNLWPVAVALGAMGWLGVAVDGGTMMIAAVVLGVAVDDTLHFLGGLRARRLEHRIEPRIRATLSRLAPAHVLTSSVLAVGFVVLALSSFLPVARFGALSAVAIAAALAGDLLWVPALAGARSSGRDERSG